eukprot:TRINITY_DN782217_c0_g1_i1.p1 TRINITY_DN782217_c0_g1~~TRINITY_DN782217_c0_g1_i1.p1  ORF type:complete len:327 (+),score=107.54 TRINITY_DN782217_c0_g1_i1:140-1120(+)
MNGRKMTPKGEMSMAASGPPPQHLPPLMKAFFAPRLAQPHVPLNLHKKTRPFTGFAGLLENFESEQPPPRLVNETTKERRERLKKGKEASHESQLIESRKKWNPTKDLENKPSATADPYKTIFVGRLDYATTERDLKRFFERVGPVKAVCLIHDLEGNSRGYAFVEMEQEADMRRAYDRFNGERLDGRRIIVDVERGRTVRDWLPRKLGGGKGDTRRTRSPQKNKKKGARPNSLPPRDSRDRHSRDERRGGGYDDRRRARSRSRERRSNFRDDRNDRRGGGGHREERRRPRDDRRRDHGGSSSRGPPRSSGYGSSQSGGQGHYGPR